MKTPQNIKQSLSLIRDAASKKVIKQFDAKYNLVYFGYVDPRQDDHELVRGITASAYHTDNHYSVGVINGHDVTLVERRNTLSFPGKPDSSYRWLIMQFDLKGGHLPHIFIDAHHHDETFFANLFIAFSHFEDTTPAIARHSQQFAQHFKVFTPHTTLGDALHVLNGAITTTLAHHFKQFDYEIKDDQLFIYASNTVLTPLILNEMLRAGLWLAGQLNAIPQHAPQAV